MERLLFNKKYSGILWSVILGGAFILLSLWGLEFLHGSKWYLFSSGLRLIFGFAVLHMVKLLYDIKPLGIFSFKGIRPALIAGAGFILYFVYYLLGWFAGIRGIEGLTLDILITRILLQQLTTGFFEELNFRVLICEGFFHSERSVKAKLIFAFASFVIFGAIHLIGGGGLFTFLQMGIIGFSFAVMYIKSGNILLPMLLHFVYDIPANLASYGVWDDTVLSYVNLGFTPVLVLMFLISLFLLLKKEKIY